MRRTLFALGLSVWLVGAAASQAHATPYLFTEVVTADEDGCNFKMCINPCNAGYTNLFTTCFHCEKVTFKSLCFAHPETVCVPLTPINCFCYQAQFCSTTNVCGATNVVFEAFNTCDGSRADVCFCCANSGLHSPCEGQGCSFCGPSGVYVGTVSWCGLNDGFGSPFYTLRSGDPVGGSLQFTFAPVPAAGAAPEVNAADAAAPTLALLGVGLVLADRRRPQA